MTSPCIILYTSGTTGRAKGVVITRENALYSSLNFAAVAQVRPDSVLLCDSPMFHTVGLVAITRTALHQGACVAISDRFVPATTLQRLTDPGLGVTHYFVVPQMVEALIRETPFERADLSRMTALFSGGGPLSPELVKTCLKAGVILINGYGMSEAGSCIHMPLDRDFIAANVHTVGFKAPYLDVRLAGADGEPVKPGEVGEIWMRGPSVSPGYWNQPEATAASRSGDWFRSGDLALQQADGAYVIVDRLKDMYISGGENVYPAEVEAALRQIEGVVDVSVIGVPDARWGEVGCAFIQLRDGAGGADAEAAIRSALSGKLARYKLPAHLRFVDAIPRTGSGKARKNLLREAFSG
jgi:fatty-acyl-CoA synthase